MPFFGIPIRNGLPIGLGSVAGFGAAYAFSPSELFANGEVGAWYDPSDYTTLFQDSAGTTPVTAVEQSVGLMLDKSKGLVLGSEAVVSPFAGTVSGSWAISSTEITRNGSSAGQASLTLSITPSTTNTYQVQFTVSNLSGDTFFYRLGSGGSAYQITANGQYTARITGGGGSTSIIFAPWAGSAGQVTISNISVKALPGNHAYQSTSTSRPVLRARYNLLTYSENLNGTGWSTLFGGTGTTPTVTSNYATAPDGTITASRFVGTRGAGNTTSDYSLSVSPNAVSVSGASYTGSIYIKSNTGSNQNVTIYIVTGASIQQSIAVAGSSWTRITPSNLTATATPCNIVIGTRGGSYGGDQSLDILVWGAQVVATNSLTSNAYQRIADAATYDTAGFLPYLAFDGTDDSLLTNSVDFSATDKMTVWAGVRKLSDAAFGVICETSANAYTTAGGFGLLASGIISPGAFYATVGNGSAGYAADFQTYTAPITNVCTGIFDIAQTSGATEQTLNVNALSATRGATAGTTMGTGNFGNYPLYIGRRNNATLPLNGNLYSLIIRGAQSSASQISATETWVNGKTGAY